MFGKLVLRTLGWVGMAVAIVASAAVAQDKTVDPGNPGEPALEQLGREQKWRDERARFLADHHTRAGIARYDELDFEAANAEFEKALQYDPRRKDARDYLRRTQAILGLRQAPVLDQYRRSVNIELELARQQMKVGLDKAGSFYDNGEFTEAVAMLDRVRELARYLAPSMNVEPCKSQADELLAKAEAARDARQAQEQDAIRRKAERVVKSNERAAKARDEQRVERLLNKARDLMLQYRYQEAKSIAETVVKADPANTEAARLRDIAVNAGIAHALAETARNANQETLLAMAQVDEACVPYTETLRYPADWGRIIRRKVETIGGEPEQEPAWMPGLREKLDQRVSFDFVETPLPDVVTFLQQVTNATIILDQKSLLATPVAEVTLKVTDMPLSQGLDWIVKQAGLRYTLRNNAVLIGNADAVAGEPRLKFYDITDLTVKIRDFPGDMRRLRDVSLNQSGPGGEVWPGEDDPKREETDAGMTILDLIKNAIGADNWGDETAVFIER